MEPNNGSPAANGSGSPEAAHNGHPDPATDPTTARAEAIVDRWAENISQITSVWGRRAYRAAARVREEAQDFWAEAQSIRHGEQP